MDALGIKNKFDFFYKILSFFLHIFFTSFALELILKILHDLAAPRRIGIIWEKKKLEKMKGK